MFVSSSRDIHIAYTLEGVLVSSGKGVDVDELEQRLAAVGHLLDPYR